MRIKTGYIFYLLVCILFTIVFIWLFVRGADWQEILKIAKSNHAIYLLMSVFALIPGFYIRIWRWAYLLKKYNGATTKKKCLVPYLSAFALNNLLPFRLGDIARVTLFKKQLNVSYATVTGSLLIERILDFFSLLIIFCAGFLYLGAERIYHPVFDYLFIIATSAAVMIGFFLAFSGVVITLLKTLHRYSLNRKMIITSNIIDFVRNIANSIYLHNTPGSVVILLTTSLSLWLVEAWVFWLVGQSMGIMLTVLESFYVMSFSTLATLLPSTPGYAGTFHYLCRLAMEQIGIASSHAILFSLLTHIVIVLPVTIIGGSSFIHFFGGAWKTKLRDSLQNKIID